MDIGCISDNSPRGVWARLRSANYNNNNNFAVVGSGAGGGVNNNNANNDGGVFAGFYEDTRSNGVAGHKPR